MKEESRIAAKLDAELTTWLAKTGDPRVVDGTFSGDDPRWDTYPYFGK